MSVRLRLLFGPFAAVLFVLGVAGLSLMLPGYDHVRQTVSEIGEVGSPVQLPFTLLLCAIAVCMVVFATAIRAASRATGHSALSAYFIGCMAISAAGVGIFSTPHPLHNVFGLSELVGYQAPLVFALAWRRDGSAHGVVRFSWLMFVLIWMAIGLNLIPLLPDQTLWSYLKPFYGLAQRALFAAWFGWCAGVGLMLSSRVTETAAA